MDQTVRCVHMEPCQGSDKPEIGTESAADEAILRRGRPIAPSGIGNRKINAHTDGLNSTFQPERTDNYRLILRTKAAHMGYYQYTPLSA